MLQNTIHWIKSIAIRKEDVGRYPGVSGNVSVGHYKPINSARYINDCHEYIFHLTKNGRVALDRLAVGVEYQDKSNIARFGSANRSDSRCRGNTWFVPYKTIKSLFYIFQDRAASCNWAIKAGRESKLPKQYACPCAARCPASSIRPDAQQEGQRPGKSRRNHQQHVNAGPVSVSNSSRNSRGSEIPEQLPKLHWLPSLLFPFLFRCPVTLCVCFCASPLWFPMRTLVGRRPLLGNKKKKK